MHRMWGKVSGIEMLPIHASFALGWKEELWKAEPDGGEIHLNSLICTSRLEIMYESTGCSGKIVFFHNSLQPLPRLHRCDAMRVYSHSYWLVIFGTTNSSRELARWQTFENSWKKHSILWTPCLSPAYLGITLARREGKKGSSVASIYKHGQYQGVWI